MSRVMIIVSVPVDNADALRQAIGDAGGGMMGNYSYCSFSYAGKGRFLPNKKANPAIGNSGHLEVVDEERVEIACDESDIKTIVNAIKKVHPYEEPAIAAYALLDLAG